jgi:hypothetical protein
MTGPGSDVCSGCGRPLAGEEVTDRVGEPILEAQDQPLALRHLARFRSFLF